jgi:Small subunit of acetolactate synthase
MTLVVTGDAGKTVTLEANLARFGIAQLARTGTVSLKRGQLLLEVTAPRARIHVDIQGFVVHSVIAEQHAATANGTQ